MLAMVSPLIFTNLLNATNGMIVACFGQNPPGQPQILPTTYAACKQAFQSIPMREKAFAPIVFSHNPAAGFKVPHSWSHGGCVVRIDVVTPDAEETTTFAAIFQRAFELSAECVIKPPHFGGKSLLGKTDMLEILVIESQERKISQGARGLKGSSVLTEVPANNIISGSIA